MIFLLAQQDPIGLSQRLFEVALGSGPVAAVLMVIVYMLWKQNKSLRDRVDEVMTGQQEQVKSLTNKHESKLEELYKAQIDLTERLYSQLSAITVRED